MKFIFLVIDGLADEPIDELGEKTPLEAANTPNLDFLASRGICYSVETYLPDGGLPTSEDSHLALFGYDPKKYNIGRGVFEALGLGIELKKGDIALRANFATVNEEGVITDRRAGRIENTEKLIEAINGMEIAGIKFLVYKAQGHRAVIVMRPIKKGVRLSPLISENNHKEIGVKPLKIVPLKKNEEAIITSEALNVFLLKSAQILKGLDLKANYLLVRGAGSFKKIPSFKRKHHLKACCIAGGGLYKGIARAMGMEVLEVEGANSFISTNLGTKVETAVESLKKYSFIFLHIKAADNLAEDGRFLEKKEFIERIDQNLKPLLFLKNTVISVTGDHATSSKQKSHSTLPSPLLFYPSDKGREMKFSEKDCSGNDIPQLVVMKKLREFSRRGK